MNIIVHKSNEKCKKEKVNMDFKDKLKEIRKYKGLSQEELADQIGVSRQAITKWETGKGLPDIENMKILAEIFKTTLDELLSLAPITDSNKMIGDRSEVIIDIDCEQHFDLLLPCANTLTIATGTDEKLHIVLMSETLQQLDQLFKIQFDQRKHRLDIVCLNKKELSMEQLYEELNIEILFPLQYSKHVEVDSNVKFLYLQNLMVDRLEYDGGANKVHIANCKGSLEFSGSTDYDVSIDKIYDRLEFYQIKAKTVLHIKPEFKLIEKGRKCHVYWKHQEEMVDQPMQAENTAILCFRGIKSELIIDVLKV